MSSLCANGERWVRAMWGRLSSGLKVNGTRIHREKFS